MPPNWSYEQDMELGRFLYDVTERDEHCKDCVKDHLNGIEVSSQLVRRGAPLSPTTFCGTACPSIPQLQGESPPRGEGAVVVFAVLVKLPGDGHLQRNHPGHGCGLLKGTQLPPSAHCTLPG